jgi:hypothetical protein
MKVNANVFEAERLDNSQNFNLLCGTSFIIYISGMPIDTSMDKFDSSISSCGFHIEPSVDTFPYAISREGH